MFLQKPKDENTLPQMRHIYFSRKASKPHGQTHSPRPNPSVFIRRNSLVARREIKKDNRADALIRLPRERRLYFERTDEAARAAWIVPAVSSMCSANRASD